MYELLQNILYIRLGHDGRGIFFSLWMFRNSLQRAVS
jgi:hypothetical protein